MSPASKPIDIPTRKEGVGWQNASSMPIKGKSLLERMAEENGPNTQEPEFTIGSPPGAHDWRRKGIESYRVRSTSAPQPASSYVARAQQNSGSLGFTKS